MGNRRLQSHGMCLQMSPWQGQALSSPDLPVYPWVSNHSSLTTPLPYYSSLGHGAQASLMCSAVDELGDIISLSAGQLVGFPASFPPSEVTLGCCRWSCVHLSLLRREEAPSRADLPPPSHLLYLFLGVLISLGDGMVPAPSWQGLE